MKAATHANGRHGATRAGRHVLITGGAGFVGTNLAHRLASEGRRVRILDNLARPGVERNALWLRRRHGRRVEITAADVRDADVVADATREAEAVFHFAAQVAVTTSLTDPVTDFDINARGTLNVLEALRARHDPPPLLFTSTNKVYGSLSGIRLREVERRYEPVDRLTRARGVGVGALDFHSPYGCSKGAADQYVLDYARTFALPAAVFRMSCIYGPHQRGNEDQGWVAHFARAALSGDPVRIYGDGRQVRDVLFVSDLIDAMLAVLGGIDRLGAQAFNVGGGPEHTLSLLELMDLLAELSERRLRVRFGEWRPGDQRYYVSDIQALQEATGWSPRIAPEQGVRRLWAWLSAAERRPEVPPGRGATMEKTVG